MTPVANVDQGAFVQGSVSRLLGVLVPARARSSALLLLVLMIGLTVNSSPAYAVAHCALRDPVTSIYRLFDAADGFRSIVRNVSSQNRDDIAELLPFSLFFNEIGRHTLYVALEDSVPVGLVHARSEMGRHGLSEFVWAMDLDLKLTGFAVQRSRDPSSAAAQRTIAFQDMRGRDYDSLRTLLDGAPEVSEEDRDTSIVMLRSAMKTLALTQLVWGEDISRLREELDSRDIPLKLVGSGH